MHTLYAQFEVQGWMELGMSKHKASQTQAPGLLLLNNTTGQYFRVKEVPETFWWRFNRVKQVLCMFQLLD